MAPCPGNGSFSLCFRAFSPGVGAEDQLLSTCRAGLFLCTCIHKDHFFRLSAQAVQALCELAVELHQGEGVMLGDEIETPFFALHSTPGFRHGGCGCGSLNLSHCSRWSEHVVIGRCESSRWLKLGAGRSIFSARVLKRLSLDPGDC